MNFFLLDGLGVKNLSNGLQDHQTSLPRMLTVRGLSAAGGAISTTLPTATDIFRETNQMPREPKIKIEQRKNYNEMEGSGQ